MTVTEKDYDDYVDSSYPMVNIEEATLLPSRVLKEMDPIAYREGYLNWADVNGGNCDSECGCSNPYCQV